MTITTRSIITALSIALFTIPNAVLAEKHYNKKLCSDPNYTCVKVRHGDTWDKLFPDADNQETIKKVNRMSVDLTPGMILALPNDLRQRDPLTFAPFPLHISPLNRTVIIVDLENQAFAAYDTFGSLVHWGPISAGKSWCPDIGRPCHTPTGNYYIQNKGNADCYSSKYPIPNGGAPMPYCMYFHGGYALHAGELPGHNASHGCVRLLYEDAEWLNKNFVATENDKNRDENKDESTEVVIR